MSLLIVTHTKVQAWSSYKMEKEAAKTRSAIRDDWERRRPSVLLPRLDAR